MNRTGSICGLWISTRSNSEVFCLATAVPTPVLGYAVVARMTTVVTLTSRDTTPLYNLGYVPIYQMELRPQVGRRSQSVGNHHIV